MVLGLAFDNLKTLQVELYASKVRTPRQSIGLREMFHRFFLRKPILPSWGLFDVGSRFLWSSAVVRRKHAWEFRQDLPGLYSHGLSLGDNAQLFEALLAHMRTPPQLTVELCSLRRSWPADHVKESRNWFALL